MTKAMIIVQLKDPTMILFLKEDFDEFMKKNGKDLAPYALTRGRNAARMILPLQMKSNIAYVRESDETEIENMTKRPQIETPMGLNLGNNPPRGPRGRQ